MKKRAFILSVFLILAVAIPLLAATFGYTSIGANGGTYSPELLLAVGPYTMSENGTATKVEIYTDISSLDPVNMVFGVYNDSAGSPGSRACITTAGGVDGSTSNVFEWRGRAISGLCTLSSGSAYWIGVNKQTGSTALGIKYDTASGHGRYRAYTYDGSLPDPFGSPTTLDQDFSLRLTYTPSGGGGGGGAAVKCPLIGAGIGACS